MKSKRYPSKRPLGRFGFPKTRLSADLAQKQIRTAPLIIGPDGMMRGNGNANEEYIKRIVENSDILVSTSILGRGFLGRQITIGTTPVQVVDGRYLRGYLFTNPTGAVGLTTTATLFGSASRSGTGNSQSAPLGVASYDSARLFLDITAITGAGSTVIDIQSQDPVSLNWATAQSDIFGAPTATGTYYANIGDIGVDRSLAAAFTVNSTTSTFSLGVVLKGGLPGGGTGLANTIFLGPDVNVSSTNGYGLLEAKELKLFLRPNVELWAVSLISGGVTLNIFDLQ